VAAKKYKIVDIHSADSWYENRKMFNLIGMVGEFIPCKTQVSFIPKDCGWQVGTFIPDDGPLTFLFIGVKLEVI